MASSDFLNLTSTFEAKFVPVMVVVELIFASPLGVISVIVGGAHVASVFVTRVVAFVNVGYRENTIASDELALAVVTYLKGADAVIALDPPVTYPTFVPSSAPR